VDEPVPVIGHDDVDGRAAREGRDDAGCEAFGATDDHAQGHALKISPAPALVL
jgi:hypothetical protein